ncbi:predicted protein [Histoplasma mississippiense (nom. inval.)]|uniref:predicted protein n=1 Tax=Ajellomyces capsulatus (strain NAm1 / WU24) TaxID=2059318 RepID=UPI000157D410|nr:predicted protein [Histoplasma mississippiense (nom. inval.)]EDN04832.1 predicted protein [Histoplasma mississippiense (nom. inval.)]
MNLLEPTGWQGSLQEKITKYNIEPGNIYNFDEKGFLLGFIHTLKRIVSINALKSGRTIGASQDGSREFITLLASICADGTSLPPALIYQGESRDMQDTWLEDFDSKKDQVYFAASENGWSNDEYGLMWLKKIFEPHTKKKAGRGYRLLILDGHSSHVNMAFINYAAQHNDFTCCLSSPLYTPITTARCWDIWTIEQIIF